MRTAAIAAVSAMLAVLAARRLFLSVTVWRPAAMTIVRRMFFLAIIPRRPVPPALEGRTAPLLLVWQAERALG